LAETRLIHVLDPRTGQLDFRMPVAEAEEVRAKSAKLRAAQSHWEGIGLDGRIEVLRRWEKAIGEHSAEIIAADSRDTGYCQVSRIAPIMVLGFLRAAIANAPAQLAGAVRQGISPAMPNIHYDSTLRAFPLVGVISPWNAPTMLSMMCAIPPLVAGCAVLVKPSEVTPRFVEAIMATLADVPELASVLGFVQGDGSTGAALIDAVDFVSFTGSVPNGRKVMEACARRFIPCDVELGGKDPLIVTVTANLDDAVSAAVRGALSATGQVCFSIERVYVERPAHDAFVAALIDRASRVRLNHPDPEHGELGPFIAGRQADIVDAQLDDAVAKGAVIRLGGKSEVIDGGRWMRPTVMTGVTHDMAVMRDETFGPVIPVMPYDSVDEVIDLANDTIFGLSAAVIAGTEEEARAIAVRINAGRVSIQDAFLTFAAAPAEADSWGASGLGGKRPGIQRYLKRQALLHNTATPAV